MGFFSEEENFSVLKFERMLQKNHIFFFDVAEFEEIIAYYLEQGKLSKAKHALKIGLEQHPTATSLKLFSIEVMIIEDDLDTAATLLAELERFEPLNSEVYIQQANLYSKLNNHHKAIDLLNYALELTDNLLDIYALIAMEYLFIEDYQTAKKYFEKCLHEDNQDYISLQQLIFCYDFLEEYDQAIAFLNSFLDKNPFCEVAWYYLGKEYLIKEDLQKALRCFDFAIASDDTFTGAYFEKARVLEQLYFYEKAIENYRITLSLDDPSPIVFLHIGRCFEKLGNDVKAEQYYLKAIHHDPQLSKSWVALANFYYARKDYKKALKNIQKAIQFEDDNATYWREYAQICFFLNDFEKATEAFLRAVELGDYSYQTLTNLTEVLLFTHKYEEALSVILELQEFFLPDDVTIFYRLAIAYAGVGDALKSAYYFKMAIEKAPEWIPFFDKKFPSFFSLDFIKEFLK